MSPTVAEPLAIDRDRVSQREAQCGHRRGMTCAALSAALGWPAGIGWDHCDRCYTSKTNHHAPPILSLAATIVRDVMNRPLTPWPEPVAQAIADRHGQPHEAGQWVIVALPRFDAEFGRDLIDAVERRMVIAMTDVRQRRRFVADAEAALLEVRDTTPTPRTRQAWREDARCGALITNHCDAAQPCPDFRWLTLASGDAAPRCARWGCPSSCRARFLDVTISCPRGHSRERDDG